MKFLLLIPFVIAAAIDIVSTVRAIANGAVERNPLFACKDDSVGNLPYDVLPDSINWHNAAVAKFCFLVFLAITLYYRVVLGVIVTVAATLVTLAVSVWNVTL